MYYGSKLRNIKINGVLTLDMLKELYDILEVQETDDRFREDTTVSYTCDAGNYDIQYFSDGDYITRIVVDCAISECRTDAEYVREAMFRLHISQSQLAANLGITKQALAQFLNGERPFPQRIKVILRDMLDIKHFK